MGPKGLIDMWRISELCIINIVIIIEWTRLILA